MFITQFVDFSKYKSDGYGGAVFISSEDMQVHLMDFKIETSLRKPTDILLLHVGSIREVITVYNTFKFSKCIFYDESSANILKFTMKDWKENFYITADGKLKTYDENLCFQEIRTDWLDVSNYLETFIPRIENVTVSIKYKILNDEKTSIRYCVNTMRMPSTTNYYITLFGNIFKSLYKAVEDVFKVTLNITQLDRYIQEKYPDFSFDSGISNIYYDCLKIFNNI